MGLMVEVTARLVSEEGGEHLGMHMQRVVVLKHESMQENLLDGATQLLADIDEVKRAIMDQAAGESANVAEHERRRRRGK